MTENENPVNNSADSSDPIGSPPDSEHLKAWKEVSEKPLDQSLWQTAIDMARSEEGTVLAETGPYSTIQLSELESLSNQVRSTTDSIEKYRLLTQQTTNNEYWFDVLTGLRFDASEKGIKSCLASSRRVRETAVDIGTGTGEVANTIFPYFNNVFAIDRVPELLQIGEKRKKRENIKFIEADVLKLPFNDDSVDVITAAGILLAFEEDDRKRLAVELRRVLKKDGFIVFSTPKLDEELGILKSDIASARSGKGLLAELIVDEVNGWNHRSEDPSWGPVILTFQEEGLLYGSYDSDSFDISFFLRDDNPIIEDK